MTDVVPFAQLIAVVSVAGLLAVWSNRLSERIRIPAPAIFLVAAAVASHTIPGLDDIPVITVQRVVTVMLILLLFDGGMHIGWRRFRSAAGAVLWIGIVGTLVTTVGVTLLAHLVFGFDWRPALLLGVALAPTDPAVVFSVLGRREIGGRSGTVLEGESGANDPVGIAAMAALVATAGSGGWHAVGEGTVEFGLEMVLGLAVGAAGGYLLSLLMRRMPLPNGALYPLQTLLGAGAIYGLATAAHGSGFLAVFVAGILVGDLRAPYKGEIERFHGSLASLGEILAFALLGLTVPLADLSDVHDWLIGLGLAVVLALVVRPLLVGALLLVIDLSRITHNKVELQLADIDLHEVVQNAVDVCRSDIDPKEQKLVVELDARHHFVRGDAARLQQVFWNLLKNAAKFTPQGGRLSLQSYNYKGTVRIDVTDSGMGIDKHLLPKIFTPFEQGGGKSFSAQFGGLGLGLAISKATIDAHGGRLTAQSEGKNAGAVFTVELPTIPQPNGQPVTLHEKEHVA